MRTSCAAVLLVYISLAFSSITVSAQAHTVSLTIDDLPFITGNDSRPLSMQDAAAAIRANGKLLAVLNRHHVPVTGFVIQKGVEALGAAGKDILHSWMDHGQDLGNHSYAHLNLSNIDLEEFEDEVVRGEVDIVPAMRAAGRKVEFFRFPFNHTGETEAKHRAMADFLTAHGYHLAPCTIENSDWMFASAYSRMLEIHDRASATRLRHDYLAFTEAQIDYFSRMNAQVIGHEPPEIMLLHDNQLNADVINQMLQLFEKRGYKWVSLSEAEKDPVYQSPDTVITKFGPMWGYRWARERGVKVDGNQEPEPPTWVSEYIQSASQRRPRSSF